MQSRQKKQCDFQNTIGMLISALFLSVLTNHPFSYMLARILGQDDGLTDTTAGSELKKVVVLQENLLSCDCHQ